ncbi:MAG: hypothetical protein WEG56_13925 [Chloroflexota bacterium]
MSTVAVDVEPNVVRQVFPNWSITIPSTLRETFVEEDAYWHAWDRRRSVSLTSMLVADRRGRPVSSRKILKQFPVEPGQRVAMPPGLLGWAVAMTPPPPARAARAISGIVIRDGGLLIATVTADDLGWAETIWRSIRRHPSPGPW